MEPLRCLKISAPLLDLSATLHCGQSFCWQREGDGWWRGWLARQPVGLRWDGETSEADDVAQSGTLLAQVHRQSEAEIRDYLQLDLDLNAVVASFPRTDLDLALHEAAGHCQGLRILRQDPWETLASFICSPQKQIVQIAQINAELRRQFGQELAPGRFSFPEPEVLAAAGKEALLGCKLGYRAKNLAASSELLAEGKLDLAVPFELPTSEARDYLKQFVGVADKVADCVLLFAYNKWDAFPVDVWVERALRELYFQRKRKVTPKRVREFSRSHFGLYGGYAQQYLFHWFRTRG